MPFYLFSIVFCLIDFLVCQYFVKWAKYDLKGSLVTAFFYASDILFVLYLRQYSNAIGEWSRKIWDFKYGFLDQLQEFVNLNNLTLIFFESKFFYWFFLFITVDFAYYWIHRANHEIGIIWTQHAVHHSTTKLNFLATQRNSFRFTTFNYQQIFFLIPMFFSFPLSDILICFAVVQCGQTLIHSEWIPRFWRPLELIINTPWHHRIHHSLECKSGNFGGVLIVFDRIFGTLVECQDQKFTYGVIGYQTTHNPIKINFQYLLRLLKTTLSQKSFITVIKDFFVPVSFTRLK